MISKGTLARCYFCGTAKLLSLPYYKRIMKKTKGIYLCQKCGGNKVKVQRRKPIVIDYYGTPLKITNTIARKMANLK